MGKVIGLFLALLLGCWGFTGASQAAGLSTLETVLADTAAQVQQMASNPGVGEVGGEWAVFGLARSGYQAPEGYYEQYYNNLEEYLKEHQGVLDERKNTTYARVILALTAAGYDPRQVAGYDLTVPLGDFVKTVEQGLNGPIYALLALDCAGYEAPLNPVRARQADRELYLAEILSRQLPGGGFSLSDAAQQADADITGMALQALAKYQDQEAVKEAVDRALDWLAGSGIWREADSASLAQLIVALSELGYDPEDPRFRAAGQSLPDKLLEYYVPGMGFSRVAGGPVNQMATEQALYALAAVYRYKGGLPGVYRMTGSNLLPLEVTSPESGLPGPQAGIQVPPIRKPGLSFPDLKGHPRQKAVEALAAREIVMGKSAAVFDPEGTVTRAEFAAMIARGLGLPERGPGPRAVFADVTPGDWFYSYVGAAYACGIVNGVDATQFNPGGLITREEAAAMTARAAALCGLETALDSRWAWELAERFEDYEDLAAWARQPVAFCRQEGILLRDLIALQPKEAVSRGEMAEMLYRLLNRAGLL